MIPVPYGVEAIVPQRANAVSGAYCFTGPWEIICAVAKRPGMKVITLCFFFRVCVDGVLPTLPHIPL